jgi:hypothetical protein
MIISFLSFEESGNEKWAGRGNLKNDHGVPAHDQALPRIVTSFHLILRLSSETSGKR